MRAILLLMAGILTAQSVLAESALQSVPIERQVQLILETHLQELLDGVAGTDRTRVSVQVEIAEGEGTARPVSGAVRDIIGDRETWRLSVQLIVDPVKKVYDAASGEIREVKRDQREIDKLALVAAKAVALQRDLGDQLTVKVESLKTIRERNRHERETAIAAEKEAKREKFWTGIAINVATIVAIVLSLIAVRLFATWRYGDRLDH